jgi:hypothetical protein
MNLCFAWISEQTAIISLYHINIIGFETEAECLLRGTDWVFKSDRYSFVLKAVNRKCEGVNPLALELDI